MTSAHFRLFASLSDEPMLLLSEDGKILAANPACSLLGGTPEALVGRHLGNVASFAEGGAETFLKQFLRSSSRTVAAATIRIADQDCPCRCDGLRLPEDSLRPPRILLRCKPREESLTNYRLLNQQVSALNQQMRERQLLSQRLEAQSEYFSTTLRSIGDAVIVTDPEGRVSLLNTVAEDLTGWKLKEAQGQPLEVVFDIVNEYTDARVENPALRALREGRIVGLANHTVLVRRDGTRIPIEDTASPIVAANGTLFGAVLVFRDVTERHEAETRLHRERKKLHTVTENASSMLLLMDADLRITYTNRAVREALGYTEAEMLGKPLRESLCAGEEEGNAPVPLDCPAEMARKRRRTVRGVEIYFRKRDGSYMPVRCAASPIVVEDCFEGVVLEAEDITDERMRAEAVEQLEMRFSQLADVINQLVWIARPDGHIEWYNNRWYQYTGTTFADMEGWGWSRVHDPEVLPQVMDRWTDAIRRGVPLEMVFPIRGADGKFRQFLTRVVPYRGPDGKVVRWFGTNTDISELKRLEENLRSVAARLLESDRRKDEFLAMLSHELRNPLTPIRTGLELLAESRDDKETFHRVRDMMERQTQQLISLVDDLLEVSRITRGKLELRKARIDLGGVVRNALDASRAALDHKHHTLTLDLPDEELWIDADPLRLTQVLSNLLHNASKFTPPGGHVALRARTDGDSQLEITVEDDGVGIAPEHHEIIFEMFTQVNDGGIRVSHGLGIGLTLVKRLVEMHGGTVAVESQGLNTGATFRLRLPMQDTSAREASTQARLPRVELRRRVLVVDDNEAVLELLGLQLEALGHVVRTACDGETAISMAEEFQPDVVLMDVGMPHMDGLEAARRIRQQPWGKHLPLIALTGWGQDSDRGRTRAAGFDLHLVKPVGADDLQRAIARTLESGAASNAD